MHSVLILWAPDTAENRKVVDAVSSVFDDAKVTFLTRKVSEATIADLTTAEIIIFGTQKTSNGDLPSEYFECVRIFKGMTLAGRTAAFFSMGTERASARLRKALKDTEIAQVEEDPVFSDQKPGKSSEMNEWVRKLVAFHQELQHVRT
jgi:flavodoxin